MRTCAAALASAGLVTLSFPVVAAATEPTHPVTIRVVINDGTDAAPLAGVKVTVREPNADARALVSGTTDSDGTVAVDVPGEQSQYIAEAEWPGSAGDLQSASATTEFPISTTAPVEVSLWGTYGTVEGTVEANVGGTGLDDLSGSSLVIRSADVPVQTIPVAGDGSFRSGALPTDSRNQYRVDFVPPAGYMLASPQTNDSPLFSLTASGASPYVTTLNPRVDLVAPAATPEPTPEPTATPEPTVTPEPTPTSTRPPVDNPSLPAGLFTVQNAIDPASTLAAAITGTTEAQFNHLIAAGRNAPVVPLMGASGTALGFVITVSPQGTSFVSVVNRLTTGAQSAPIVPSQGASVAVDLPTATSLAYALPSSVARLATLDELSEAQSRNAQISQLIAARNALTADVRTPTDAAHQLSIQALLAAGIDDPYLTAAPRDRPALADGVQQRMNAMLDEATNAQQASMLRLQDLTAQRDTFAAMTSAIERLNNARSSIVGTMRSTPIALGTVQWNSGAVTGAFDFSRVQPGEHHLILNAEDAGTVLIAGVTVGQATPERLAATGADSTTASVLGAALLSSGVVVHLASLTRRKKRTS